MRDHAKAGPNQHPLANSAVDLVRPDGQSYTILQGLGRGSVRAFVTQPAAQLQAVLDPSHRQQQGCQQTHACNAKRSGADDVHDLEGSARKPKLCAGCAAGFFEAPGALSCPPCLPPWGVLPSITLVFSAVDGISAMQVSAWACHRAALLACLTCLAPCMMSCCDSLGWRAPLAAGCACTAGDKAALLNALLQQISVKQRHLDTSQQQTLCMLCRLRTPLQQSWRSRTTETAYAAVSQQLLAMSAR